MAKDVRIAGVSDSTDPFRVGEFTGLSTSNNAGRGGDLRLTADSVLVTSQGAISSASFGSRNAGNIEVNSGSLFVTDRASIDASVIGAFARVMAEIFILPLKICKGRMAAVSQVLLLVEPLETLEASQFGLEVWT